MSALKIPSAAFAISSSINRLAFKLRHRSRSRPVLLAVTSVYGLHCCSRRMATAAVESVATEHLEICVKASVTTPDRLGDCPFSQRILLTVEEKQLSYSMKLVDMGNKPEWFLKINTEGKVPVIKIDEKWIADSDVITQTLEEKFPSPPLATPPEKAPVGSKIFSMFIGFLKSKSPSDGTELQLLNELTSFNDHIKENGPYINGKEVSAADLSLGPKLYHMEIALSHYKSWAIPDSLPYVKSYMQNVFSRDSFVKTRALKEDVIAGWRPKVMG
ncbi:hypothetical protein SAY87_020725 [Trapa incisa]|uniref:GST N-terminal domain-containing protein n=1 Tax=Trapa incisa TaxID=236973 RepID=A0AAN7JRW2_9MYRT|nr:hypothetical protein SAY87_020725 [Trapa incisa]